MKNRIVALMLGMVMVASTLVGCGSDAQKESSSQEEKKETSVEKEEASEEVSSEEEEPLKIKIIYYNNAGFPGVDGTPTQEYIEERFNVDFEVVPIDVLNAEQYSLFLAQGETADVYTIGNTGVEKELFEQGLVREISYEDMWEYMPTYMQNCADNCGGEEMLSKVILQSGKYTRIPYVSSATADCAMMIVRKDWLDKVGIAPEEINSLEALEKVMHAFTYDDPDGNGVDDTHALTAGHGGFRFAYIHGAYMARPDSYTLEDGKVTATFALDRYKECLQLLNKWYEAGYFTSEAATDDRGAERAKWAAGQIGILFDTSGWCQAGESGVIGMVEAVNPDAEFAFIPGFEGPYGGGTVQAETVSQGGDGTVMFDADCSDEIVHKIMEIKEALVTDQEFFIRCRAGVAGEDFIYDDEGYVVVETPLTVEQQVEKGLGNAWGLALIPNSYWYGKGAYKPSELITTTEAMVESLNTEFQNLGWDKNYVVDGVNEARDLKGADVSTIAWRYYWDAILGNVDIEETWEDYLADLNDAGLQEILDGDQAILVQ